MNMEINKANTDKAGGKVDVIGAFRESKVNSLQIQVRQYCYGQQSERFRPEGVTL